MKQYITIICVLIASAFFAGSPFADAQSVSVQRGGRCPDGSLYRPSPGRASTWEELCPGSASSKKSSPDKQTSAEAGTSFSDFSTRISALVKQIDELKKRLDALKKGDDTPTASGDRKYCENFTHMRNNFRRGSWGDDVKVIQRFLSSEAFLKSDLVTGYYGEKTEAAVKMWQNKHGVVSSGDPSSTGFGLVGERTRSAMYRRCTNMPGIPGNGGGSSLGQSASVDFGKSAQKVEGRRPFTVTFTSSKEYPSDTIVVEFGDGTQSTFSKAGCASSPRNMELCAQPRALHTYEKTGTYVATLRATNRTCIAAGCDVIATATVVVTNQLTADPVPPTNVCTLEYAPVCGKPTFYCPPGALCPMLNPTPTTYSNECVMKGAGATLLYKGECKG